jgi:hypothetical protein
LLSLSLDLLGLSFDLFGLNLAQFGVNFVLVNGHRKGLHEFPARGFFELFCDRSHGTKDGLKSA